MILRICLFLTVLGTTETAVGLISQTADPAIRTHLAVEDVNGDSTTQRAYEHARSRASAFRFLGYTALGAFLFWPRRRAA